MTPTAIVRQAYSAFGRGDAAGLAATFAHDIAWHSAEGNPVAPDGGPWIGPQTVIDNLLVGAGANWDAFAVAPSAFHDAGEVVVVEGRYTGRHKATGRPLDAQVCHVWIVRDGRIARFQQYVDTAQLQAVTGFRA